MNNKEYQEKYKELFSGFNCGHSKYSAVSYDNINPDFDQGIYGISIDDIT